MYCSLLPEHYHVEFLYLCAFFFQDGMDESVIAETLMEQFLTFLRVKNRENGDLQELVDEHHADARACDDPCDTRNVLYRALTNIVMSRTASTLDG